MLAAKAGSPITRSIRPMSGMRLTIVGCVLSAGAALFSAGCGDVAYGPNEGSQLSAEDFLLSEEPPGAAGVARVKTQLKESDSPAEVTVEGRIGGVDGQIWDPQRAVFMIVDLEIEPVDAEEVGPAHDADNCPFCRAKTKKLLESTAIIEIHDEQGEVPSLDARQLLGFEEGQTIVARGQGEIDSLGTLVVKARRIFVRN
jgi:hypothetical protein